MSRFLYPLNRSIPAEIGLEKQDPPMDRARRFTALDMAWSMGRYSIANAKTIETWRHMDQKCDVIPVYEQRGHFQATPLV